MLRCTWSGDNYRLEDKNQEVLAFKTILERKRPHYETRGKYIIQFSSPPSRRMRVSELVNRLCTICVIVVSA